MSIPFSSYQPLALDIDGTLLRGDHELSPAVAKAIGILSRHGVEVILTCARPPRSLLAVAGALQMSRSFAALKWGVSKPGYLEKTRREVSRLRAPATPSAGVASWICLSPGWPV